MNQAPIPGRLSSAADFAARFGVTVKALRVYERHGLLKPGRSASDWRLYGPDEARVLMSILVLRRLGVPLARMKPLLAGREGLDGVLALRQAALQSERRAVEENLAIVGTARDALARGQELSLDDLARLGQSLADPRFLWTADFEALAGRFFAAEQVAALRARDEADDLRRKTEWGLVLADAERLRHGDPGAPEARELAVRWMRLVAVATGGDPQIHNAAYAMFSAAAADPAQADHVPGSKAIWDFLHETVARMRADGEEARLFKAARGEDR